MHSWTGFSGVRASSLLSPATGTAESWFGIGKGKMTPCQPQQACREDLQMPACGDCDEFPGGWCSPGLLGMVTASLNREGSDSHNIYHEPVPGHSRYRGNRSCGPCYAVPAPLSGQGFSRSEHCSSHSKRALGTGLTQIAIQDWPC